MDHRTRIDESHGIAASLYSVSCSCGWVGSDSFHRETAEEEARRHLERLPMRGQEATEWPDHPLHPPLPEWGKPTRRD